ncbi:MAG TPA: ComEC/Rec2 family competence protein, partial [Campylobacterales bacterium]|nr:ComEC/Rec2 family competence protein [Campylobacterales bacterium]
MLEKPKLFLTAKEFWLTMALLSVLILVRLGFLYEEYSTFKIKPFYYTHVEVLKQYQKSKDNKNYTILRVHSSALNLDFFTRTYSQKNLLNKQVRLKL